MLKKYQIDYGLDDPRATIAHKKIILEKPLLKKIYIDWYKQLLEYAAKAQAGDHLELGSGGGFLKELFPKVITSDILELPDVEMQINAEELPFKNEQLASIMMLNVFHHIPRPYLFLKEAERCLQPGGYVVMIEPANTFFSRFIYKNFHHEPFDPNGPREIKPGNPMSNSNQALPYIYFIRDEAIFTKEFPELQVVKMSYHSPFSYIASGGVSRAALMPARAYGILKTLEKWLSPINRYIALFTTIVIQKKEIASMTR